MAARANSGLSRSRVATSRPARAPAVDPRFAIGIAVGWDDSVAALMIRMNRRHVGAKHRPPAGPDCPRFTVNWPVPPSCAFAPRDENATAKTLRPRRGREGEESYR